MRILQLSKFYKPYYGGLESVVADISEGLVDREHQVTVIAVCKDKNSNVDIVNGVKIYKCKELFSFDAVSFSLSYIVQLIREISMVDIIHVHLPNPLANIGLLLASIVNRNGISPIVLHWHSDIIKQKKMLVLYRPLMNWLIRKASKIIVTSQRYLDYSEQLQGFKEKCCVVPIGIQSLEKSVDTKKVKEIKEEYGNKNIVFSLGRHIYYKGFEFLIEAAVSFQDTVFLIGGSGPDTDKYRRLIAECNLEGRVILLGKIPKSDLPSYYSAADIFCFPSIEKSEAFGVVQLEAMSLGTPVVCMNIAGSGVSWVNLHNVSGYVCPPKNVSELERAIKGALIEQEKSARLSEGASKRFQNTFSYTAMIDGVELVLKSVVKLAKC